MLKNGVVDLFEGRIPTTGIQIKHQIIHFN